MIWVQWHCDTYLDYSNAYLQAAGRSRLLGPGQANFVFWGSSATRRSRLPWEFSKVQCVISGLHILISPRYSRSIWLPWEREHVFSFQWVQSWSNLDYYRQFGDLVKARCQISPFKQGLKYIKILNGFQVFQDSRWRWYENKRNFLHVRGVFVL